MRQDGQEQLSLRLHQAAQRCARLDAPVPARFLSGAERSLALHAAKEAGVAVAFDGGWPDAQRVQPCFHPAGEAPAFTAVWMEARWNARFAQVDHRALLGSLMALGMDRAFFGDIIALEDHAFLFVLPEMAARLPMEWNQAGRASLSLRLLPQAPEIQPPRGRSPAGHRGLPPAGQRAGCRDEDLTGQGGGDHPPGQRDGGACAGNPYRQGACTGPADFHPRLWPCAFDRCGHTHPEGSPAHHHGSICKTLICRNAERSCSSCRSPSI